MNPKINFSNLVRQLLPTHKRQPVRLTMCRVMVEPLKELFGEYDHWRDLVRHQINMTAQVGVLEGYLRAKYGTPAIYIVSYTDQGLAVGLIIEGEGTAARVGLMSEVVYAEVPLHGEVYNIFEGVDFVVYVPFGVDVDSVAADIERYKQALTTYKIVQQ